MIGLIIAELLHDRPHKSLYIKLAKYGDANRFMEIARDVSERGPVQNKGAYFMTILENHALIPKVKLPDRIKPQKAVKAVKPVKAKKPARGRKKRA